MTIFLRFSKDKIEIKKAKKLVVVKRSLSQALSQCLIPRLFIIFHSSLFKRYIKHAAMKHDIEIHNTGDTTQTHLDITHTDHDNIFK